MIVASLLQKNKSIITKNNKLIMRIINILLNLLGINFIFQIKK